MIQLSLGSEFRRCISSSYIRLYCCVEPAPTPSLRLRRSVQGMQRDHPRPGRNHSRQLDCGSVPSLRVKAPVLANSDFPGLTVAQAEVASCSTLMPTCRGSTEVWSTSARVSSPVSGWHGSDRSISGWCRPARPLRNRLTLLTRFSTGCFDGCLRGCRETEGNEALTSAISYR